MRLSPWHLELAKRVAQGQPNRDIMKDIQVSGSRLSVLKANPLFQRQVDKYRQQEQDAYMQALRVYEEAAKDVAQGVVEIAKSSLIEPDKRLKAAQDVLDRLGQVSGVSTKSSDGDEVTFEQILRVTKRQRGEAQDDLDNDQTGFDYDAAVKQLRDDLIDVTPQQEIQSA
jgi:hypothetical protein